MNNADYRINVKAFEGPLDLLLYLIKKNDISIADIPIAFILEEYLKYIDELEDMNIDIAGEFLAMAAELVYIKSKMLLPDEGVTDDEEADPRADLVNRLLEYQRYKEAAVLLSNSPILNRDVFLPFRHGIRSEAEGDVETDVFELINAFAKILIKLPKERFHDIVSDRISVNERIMQMIHLIEKGKTLRLEELLEKPLTRYGIIITFLAVLEMAKLKMIQLFQSNKGLFIKGVMAKVGEEDLLKLVKSEDSINSAKEN